MTSTDKLFQDNAIFSGTRELVPEFRLVERFGIRAMHWIDHIDQKEGGVVYCGITGLDEARYLTRTAFRSLIGIINFKTLNELYFLSDAKLLTDEARAQQEAEREAARAEEEGQRQERKAKRAAARSKREAAQK